MNFPPYFQSQLTSKVSDFINGSQWHFPVSVLEVFPYLSQIAAQVTLPIEVRIDKLIWNQSSIGELSFKEAFLFKTGLGQNINWAKNIWCPDIPPSKSLLVWRLMFNKVPTDENLSLRGSFLPSMCSSCKSQSEDSHHLFVECLFALKMWSWLASILTIDVPLNSKEDIWLILERGWSP